MAGAPCSVSEHAHIPGYLPNGIILESSEIPAGFLPLGASHDVNYVNVASNCHHCTRDTKHGSGGLDALLALHPSEDAFLVWLQTGVCDNYESRKLRRNNACDNDEGSKLVVHMCARICP